MTVTLILGAGGLPEAVSFHHKGLNHTDPGREGTWGAAECWAPPRDHGDKSAHESLLRQGHTQCGTELKASWSQ